MSPLAVLYPITHTSLRNRRIGTAPNVSLPGNAAEPQAQAQSPVPAPAPAPTSSQASSPEPVERKPTIIAPTPQTPITNGLATIDGNVRQQRLDLINEDSSFGESKFNTAPADKGPGYGWTDEFGVSKKGSVEKGSSKVRFD